MTRLDPLAPLHALPVVSRLLCTVMQQAHLFMDWLMRLMMTLLSTRMLLRWDSRSSALQCTKGGLL